MQTIDKVTSVDQVKLLQPTGVRLVVSITLICEQVLDVVLRNLALHHLHEVVRVVVGLDVIEDAAQLKGGSTRTASCIQSCAKNNDDKQP